MKNLVSTCIPAIGALFIASALPATAMVIDFEGASGTVSTDGGSVTIDGFDFTLSLGNPGGFLSVISQGNIVETGTTKLFAANHAIVTVTSNGGGLFDLSSFDLGGSFVGSPDRWADTVDVTADIQGLGQTTLNVDLPESSPGYVSTTWALTNLLSLSFAPTGNENGGINNFEFTLDNLDLTTPPPVPLPASALLLLAGLGTIAPRRNSRA